MADEIRVLKKLSYRIKYLLDNKAGTKEQTEPKNIAVKLEAS